jgi:acyl dehydratase
MNAHDVTVGFELPPVRIDPISRRTLALFAGASGDHMPVHIDLDAARARGRDDVFVHGMLSMAYLSRILTQWVPQDRVRAYKARFVAITPLHAQPTATGRVVAVEGPLATVEVTLTLADGTVVVRGEARIELDSTLA